MIALLIYLKHRFPFLWRMVDVINGLLFGLRYGMFRFQVARILQAYHATDFRLAPLEEADLSTLHVFLTSQPEESLRYFAPHPFDLHTLKRLHSNRAFLMMKAIDKFTERFAGYFFLRGFFIGRAFHGLIVDAAMRGKGIGTAMWGVSEQICRACDIAMYATISRHNPASIISAARGTTLKLEKILADDFLLVRCLPQMSKNHE